MDLLYRQIKRWVGGTTRPVSCRGSAVIQHCGADTWCPSPQPRRDIVEGRHREPWRPLRPLHRSNILRPSNKGACHLLYHNTLHFDTILAQDLDKEDFYKRRGICQQRAPFPETQPQSLSATTCQNCQSPFPLIQSLPQRRHHRTAQSPCPTKTSLFPSQS
ncbi:hypothetical protein CONLIGDRAFT_378607 [Coniochaeta ligniaria NRRL 30616]|uniref:Uncharacterized protein n=1 Tax=Coniochaeta ligniaria NRRL 30616 TaxID=1408157 RepID=A0A1J7IM70_9PEZI|nr:hypothetical protein CONLIGDRAFT_378607 [Coniochaeta ligniaria NRRL 30616]